jgi:hypothetical protein
MRNPAFGEKNIYSLQMILNVYRTWLVACIPSIGVEVVKLGPRLN